MKTEDRIKLGKKSKAHGAAFELRVRKDLEDKGWIVDKWSNNVEIHKENSEEVSGKFGGPFGKLISAKAKWAGPNRPMMMGAGFPDFICFKPRGCSTCYARTGHESKENCIVVGVESKISGTLDKEEKQKCQWYLDNNVLSKILIAEKLKIKNRVHIKYHDFKDKYGGKKNGT